MYFFFLNHYFIFKVSIEVHQTLNIPLNNPLFQQNDPFCLKIIQIISGSLSSNYTINNYKSQAKLFRPIILFGVSILTEVCNLENEHIQRDLLNVLNMVRFTMKANILKENCIFLHIYARSIFRLCVYIISNKAGFLDNFNVKSMWIFLESLAKNNLDFFAIKNLESHSENAEFLNEMLDVSNGNQSFYLNYKK